MRAESGWVVLFISQLHPWGALYVAVPYLCVQYSATHPSLSNASDTACFSPFPIVLRFSWAYAGWQGRQVAGYFRSHRDCYLYLFFYCCISNSLFMDILYKRYFGHLRLLMSTDVENSGPRASRMTCRVLCANIRGLHKNLPDLSLIARGGDVFFFIFRLLSLPGATFLSLWFQILAEGCSCWGVRLIGFEGWLYTCVMAFRHIDSAVMDVDVVKSQLSGFVVAIVIFMRSACTEVQIYRIHFFIVCWRTWIRCSSWIEKRFSVWWRRECSPWGLGCSMTNLHGRAVRDCLTVGLWAGGYEAYTHWWMGAWLVADRCFWCCMGFGWLWSYCHFYWCVMEQPIPHMVCRQEVYPKNSVNWELVRDVKGLNWNGIIRSSCPALWLS